jgi:hypothetical protein
MRLTEAEPVAPQVFSGQLVNEQVSQEGDEVIVNALLRQLVIFRTAIGRHVTFQPPPRRFLHGQVRSPDGLTTIELSNLPAGFLVIRA